MRTSVVLAVVAAALFVTGPSLAARQRPNLSGTWTFLESRVTTRDGQDVPAHILFVDGGGFNCAAACTIVQDARTLRVSRPEENGKKPRDIVLTFEAGRGAGSPSADDAAAGARWDGQKLLVTNSMGTMTIHQTIAVQKDRMVVTSQLTTGTTPGEIRRQTYVRH
jgi:hypothetical protein